MPLTLCCCCFCMCRRCPMTGKLLADMLVAWESLGRHHVSVVSQHHVLWCIWHRPRRNSMQQACKAPGSQQLCSSSFTTCRKQLLLAVVLVLCWHLSCCKVDIMFHDVQFPRKGCACMVHAECTPPEFGRAGVPQGFACGSEAQLSKL